MQQHKSEMKERIKKYNQQFLKKDHIRADLENQLSNEKMTLREINELKH